jgi:hypothetical protein
MLTFSFITANSGKLAPSNNDLLHLKLGQALSFCFCPRDTSFSLTKELLGAEDAAQ